jgi:hypothetical protein
MAGFGHPEQALSGALDALVNTAPFDERYLRAVRDGGVAVSVNGNFEDQDRLRTVRINAGPDAPGLAEVVRLAESGVFGLRLGQVFDASEAAAAYRAFEHATGHGRVVITF